MMAWMMLFWVVLFGGAAWLVVSVTRSNGRAEALRTLKGRLAAGEIDVQEFDRRAAALRRQSGPGSVVRRFGLAFVAAAAVGAALLGLAAASCMNMSGMHGGRDASGDPLTQGGMTAEVRISDFTFEPGNLEVPVGASVTWTNEDSVPHDATARDADWKTERLSDDESDTVTLDEPGEYDYYCSIHPSMKARVVVR
jgi:plastocyanin